MGIHASNTSLDKTFKLFDRDLTLRADAIQTEHQHNWVASLGGLYSFCKYFALESWVNQPVHNLPASFTIKFDFSFKF